MGADLIGAKGWSVGPQVDPNQFPYVCRMQQESLLQQEMVVVMESSLVPWKWLKWHKAHKAHKASMKRWEQAKALNG